MAVITFNSISSAWVEAARVAIASPGREAISLVVNIDCDSEGRFEEDIAVRRKLNRLLEEKGLGAVETVARTIFPHGLWNRQRPREILYARYLHILPKLRKCSKNKRGQYFERLIRFPQARRSDQYFNQLEHIIQTYANGNHRRSALQASLVNPFLDANNSRQLGFPCLHQVAFLPNPSAGTLRIVAYYPLQYLFERAYGNYLGLLYLGEFMSKEMGFWLEGLTCIAAVGAFEHNAKYIQHFDKPEVHSRSTAAHATA
jgi:hypothetical protein